MTVAIKCPILVTQIEVINVPFLGTNVFFTVSLIQKKIGFVCPKVHEKPMKIVLTILLLVKEEWFALVQVAADLVGRSVH